MVELLDGYAGPSCIMKVRNNDLISIGVLHRTGKNFIDMGNSHSELPIIPYNLLVKIEVYNTQLGFRVLIGRVYLSSPKLARIIDLNEATNDERREYFRISTRDKTVICNCIRRDELMNPGEELEHDSTRDSADYNGLKVQLVDISLGGLMLRTDEIFKIDDRPDIMIPAMGDSMLFAYGMRERMSRPEDSYGYGCKFMETTTR